MVVISCFCSVDRDRLRERDRQARVAMSLSIQAEKAATGGGSDTRHHHHNNHAHNANLQAIPLFRAPVRVSRKTTYTLRPAPSVCFSIFDRLPSSYLPSNVKLSRRRMSMSREGSINMSHAREHPRPKGTGKLFAGNTSSFYFKHSRVQKSRLSSPNIFLFSSICMCVCVLSDQYSLNINIRKRTRTYTRARVRADPSTARRDEVFPRLEIKTATVRRPLIYCRR